MRMMFSSSELVPELVGVLSFHLVAEGAYEFAEAWNRIWCEQLVCHCCSCCCCLWKSESWWDEKWEEEARVFKLKETLVLKNKTLLEDVMQGGVVFGFNNSRDQVPVCVCVSWVPNLISAKSHQRFERNGFFVDLLKSERFSSWQRKNETLKSKTYWTSHPHTHTHTNHWITFWPNWNPSDHHPHRVKCVSVCVIILWATNRWMTPNKRRRWPLCSKVQGSMISHLKVVAEHKTNRPRPQKQQVHRPSPSPMSTHSRRQTSSPSKLPTTVWTEWFIVAKFPWRLCWMKKRWRRRAPMSMKCKMCWAGLDHEFRRRDSRKCCSSMPLIMRCSNKRCLVIRFDSQGMEFFSLFFWWWWWWWWRWWWWQISHHILWN